MQKGYKTTYSVIRWDSPENLAEQLNLLVNDGWRCDLTRLFKSEETGWSILTKTEGSASLLDATVRLSEIYQIINSLELDYPAAMACIDAKLKQLWEKQSQ